MTKTLVLTLLGPDRPGIVESIAQTVSDHGGSWQESRMSQLSGHFAGLARISCPANNIEPLSNALARASSNQLHIHLLPELENSPEPGSNFELDVVGNDRPGIISQLTQTLRQNSANIVEIETRLEPAPSSGIALFHTLATISLSSQSDPTTLISSLENLSPDLQISCVPA
ncbi:MAG: ACT domain-containing protein [Verrucomicrobiota bacterium]